MENQDKAERLITDARRLAALFSAVTSIPVQIADAAELQKGFFCCGFCRLLAQQGILPQNCAARLLTYGKCARDLGGVHLFFCPSGLVGCVSPVVSHGHLAAVAAAGPFRMKALPSFGKKGTFRTISLSPSVTDEVLRRLQHLPMLSPAQISRTSLLLQAVFQPSGSAVPPYDYSSLVETALSSAIKSGGVKRSEEIIKRSLSQLFALHGKDTDSLRNHCLQFTLMLCRLIADAKPEEESAQSAFDPLLRRLQNAADTASIRLCIRRVAKLAAAPAALGEPRQMSDAVRDAVSYIRRNYMAKITLETASEHVFLSPSYLSRKFKEETGKNFNRYLSEVRTEAAKQLLENSGAELSDIAQSVGFEDQSYFSKVFRRTQGMTPKEYRRSANHT